MSTEQDDIQRLLGASSETFQEHSKRVGELLEKVQRKFEKDYTSFTATLAVCMIAAGAALAWLDKSPAFAVTVAVLGGLFFALALVLRHMSANSQVANAKSIVELEKERSRIAMKSGLLQHLWLYGPPKNLQFDQIRFLLSDSETQRPPPAPETPLLKEGKDA
jgi:hypothetical protein